MATAGVEFKLDLSKFPGTLSDKIAHGVAIDIRRRAKRIVRVGKGYPGAGRLRNSIKTERVGSCHYITFSETPYAAAQEYGLAPYGKPNYGFTPYMRPAAQEVTAPSNVKIIAGRAAVAVAATGGK